MLPNVELQKVLAEEILNIHNLDGGYVFSLIRALVDVVAPVFCLFPCLLFAAITLLSAAFFPLHFPFIVSLFHRAHPSFPPALH